MTSFYRSTIAEFLSQPAEHILAGLAFAYAQRGFTRQFSDQTIAWEHDLRHLGETLKVCVQRTRSACNWGILLEFSIPRKEFRSDIVLLIGEKVVIIEAKSGNSFSTGKRQIEEYCLLLHYFHNATANLRIVPIVVTPDAPDPNLDELNQYELFPQLAIYWVSRVVHCRWGDLSEALCAVGENSGEQISPFEWDDSPYRPVPSIIEAALQLRSGLSIRDIALSEASEHEIESVRRTIQGYVNTAREAHRHIICFLTGVPGSGKTLVGLGLAHSEENQENAIHFMSGNGPLVKVLQHLFTQESMRNGQRAAEARARACTLIENVHVFARYHTDDNQLQPSNHAIIFDEAQRAWNRAQNYKKFKRDYAEPEMLLRIMERHDDWAAVIALVGGGQEINDGEAGLEEWGLALSTSTKKWDIYASPEVLTGGPSTAGHRLFGPPATPQQIVANNNLHLRTSNRSIRAEKLAMWVNYLLDGDCEAARTLGITDRFPIFLSRSLKQARSWLERQKLGPVRFGLVGSSGATRLRAEGLEPDSSFHAGYSWEHWFLAEESDIRSSYRCEVFATEFEIQGLELDWIGLCWGGDLVWNAPRGWLTRSFRTGASNRWNPIKNPEKRNYRMNAYRVLLTRARHGMVIFVPQGDGADETNLPSEFDATAAFLEACGVIPLTGLHGSGWRELSGSLS